jgi:hypothetical protein
MTHPAVPFTRALLFSASVALCDAVIADDTQTGGSTPRMPTVTVLDRSLLTEDQPADDTGRPEWTSARRFGNTRVYIQQAPWEVSVESWWRMENHRNNTISHRLLEEVEIGLPFRMQLDLYNDIEGDQKGRFHYQSFNVELRYALADWGKIWGNPTLYSEYKFADHHWGPDVYEEKLLLGDQIGQRWHWGVNFVWEAELGGDREQEFQITTGLSYTVIDGKLGVGIETLYDHDSVKGARGHAAEIFAVGPSIQWRVTKHIHIDLNCMFGTNRDSDREIGFLIVGYDFGSGESKKSAYNPISGRRD